MAVDMVVEDTTVAAAMEDMEDTMAAALATMAEDMEGTKETTAKSCGPSHDEH